MIMKFIRENYKKITIVTFIMAFTLLAFSKINSSYADTTTKEFTRKELQDMVVATATSYLRNNTYSTIFWIKDCLFFSVETIGTFFKSPKRIWGCLPFSIFIKPVLIE